MRFRSRTPSQTRESGPLLAEVSMCGSTDVAMNGYAHTIAVQRHSQTFEAIVGKCAHAKKSVCSGDGVPIARTAAKSRELRLTGRLSRRHTAAAL